jgi:hypothetical protein
VVLSLDLILKLFLMLILIFNVNVT